MIEITPAIARKVLNTVDAGLVSGVGQPALGEMCAEAAICFALGEPHGDKPTCVAPALRAFTTGLNDAAWSTPQVRAAGSRRLALAQLGTADAFDAIDFATRLAMMTVSKIVPRVLRVAAGMKLPAKHSEALEAAALKCEAAADIDAAIAASYAASYAARAASYAAIAASDAAIAASNAAIAASYAARAASYAARAASYAASYAVSAASYAASAASDAAIAARNAARAASYAGRDAARDKELAAVAEDVVQILIEMNVSGVQWLDLAPLKTGA